MCGSGILDGEACWELSMGKRYYTTTPGCFTTSSVVSVLLFNDYVCVYRFENPLPFSLGSRKRQLQSDTYNKTYTNT